MLLSPIRLADHASGGRRTSSATTAARSEGRRRCQVRRRRCAKLRLAATSERAAPKALAASVMVITNLKRKRGVSAAAAMSGRGPSVATKTTAATAIAAPAASHQADESGAGWPPRIRRKRLDEFVGIHHCRPNRLAIAVRPRCSATRTAPSLMPRFSAVSLIECPSTVTAATTERWPGASVARARSNLPVADGFRFRCGEGFGDLVDVDLHPPPLAAKGIDELVARNRVEPWQHGPVIAPGVALQVYREQRLLHDVLRVDPASHDLPSSEAAHEAGCPPEEFGIGSFVAADRGAHQPGKFALLPAVQACFLPEFVRGPPLLQWLARFCSTAEAADHEFLSPA